MNLKNYFYVFPEAIPHHFCDDLVNYGNSQTFDIATTGDSDTSDISKLYKQRNSSIVWMDEPWIYNLILPFVKEANIQAGWNYDITQSEACQWTKYAETQHYDWHMDSFDKPHNQVGKPIHGLVRKVSVTVSLCDGNEYEGGDLQLDLRNKKDSTSNVFVSEYARKKGAITVFPSFIWHRVTPVTKGTRYSLVVWNCGKPFR